MKTEADYRKLVADLELVERTIESRRGMYAGTICLTQENADRENVLDGNKDGEHQSDFWDRMYCAAANAAGFRAEELGLNVNDELGYSIY